MKLIIDIPDSAYDFLSNTVDAIAVGTPLEKHDEEIIKETVESIWGKQPYNELLDEIRAEIENECEPCIYEIDFAYTNGLSRALEIIDKYKKGDKE